MLDISRPLSREAVAAEASGATKVASSRKGSSSLDLMPTNVHSIKKPGRQVAAPEFLKRNKRVVARTGRTGSFELRGDLAPRQPRCHELPELLDRWLCVPAVSTGLPFHLQVELLVDVRHGSTTQAQRTGPIGSDAVSVFSSLDQRSKSRPKCFDSLASMTAAGSSRLSIGSSRLLVPPRTIRGGDSRNSDFTIGMTNFSAGIAPCCPACARARMPSSTARYIDWSGRRIASLHARRNSSDATWLHRHYVNAEWRKLHAQGVRHGMQRSLAGTIGAGERRRHDPTMLPTIATTALPCSARPPATAAVPARSLHLGR